MKRPFAWRAHFNNHLFKQAAQARLSSALPEDVVGVSEDDKPTGDPLGAFKQC
jgi:hypothetical protein